jgi:hypothetical protein
MKPRFRTRKESYFKKYLPEDIHLSFPYIHWQIRALSFEMERQFDTKLWVFQFRLRFIFMFFKYPAGSGEYRRVWEVGWTE